MVRSRRYRQRTTHRHGGRSGLASKKNVAAAALVIVMGIMWVRILTGKKPKSSGAQTPAPTKKEEQNTASANIRFVDLPVIPGRNDTIDHDFFAVQDWRNFTKVSGASGPAINSEVQNVQTDWNREVIARVAQKLKLEGVFPPNAMINNQLLQVGDSITVKHGTVVYAFDVVQIDEDSVVVKHGGHELTLTLELAQSNDVSN